MIHRTPSWPDLIRGLMIEHDMSIRELSRRSGLNRASLHRFLRGRSALNIVKLEHILGLFGYELDAIKRPESEGV